MLQNPSEAVHSSGIPVGTASLAAFRPVIDLVEKLDLPL